MAGICFTPAHEAITRIPDGSSVILPLGCAEPSTFYDAFTGEVDRFQKLRLFSGLQFGNYGFLKRGLGKNFTYATWHVGAPVRKLVAEGRVDYLPMRYTDVPRQFSAPDVAVVQTSPPNENGEVSLGVSVSLSRQLALSAKMIIAEVSEHMPFTCGESTLAGDRIECFIEGGGAPTPVPSKAIDEVSARIAAHAAGLVPQGASLQLGIGTVPDALLSQVEDRGIKIHSGMITDRIISFVENTNASVVTGEVVGSRALFDFVNDNPAIQLAPSSFTHDLRVLGALEKFVSVNSALEVDLSGQINSEAVNGNVVSGIGGSTDFALGATLSPGGASVVALPSTAGGGTRSRIVEAFAPGTPVTIPRHCVDYVVTEYGVAELRGKTLAERARALCAIAHPKFRDKLAEAA